MNRALLLIAMFVAAPLSAEPMPYPQPPYPQQQGPYPGLPPMLSLPALKADFVAKAGSDTVRFGRDSYVLTPQSQTVLTAQAQWLLANPYVSVTIEGHADGRQTRDYALALGERRAAAVRNFLIASGVMPQQIEIVSWGKERPAVAAAHDATWLQNSRAVTVLKQPPMPQFWSPQQPGQQWPPQQTQQQPPIYG